MRANLVVTVIITAIIGLVMGVSGALARVWIWPWQPAEITAVSSASARPISTEAPRAVVDQPVYDFGIMDEHSRGRHEFLIRNEGTAPLNLDQGSTSCRCTSSLVQRTVVPPGESTTIVVEWTGKDYVGPFTQTATILSNDPRKPRIVLTVRGKIVQAVQVVPKELVLTRVPAGRMASGQFQIYGFVQEPLELVSWQFGEEKTASFFELSLRPLTEEELKAQEGATSGYAGEVRIKPGLPLGAFEHKILLRTNLEIAKTIELPIRGTVVSDISVVATGWDDSKSLLRLGTFPSARGLKRTLLLRVANEIVDQVKFEVAEVEPSFVVVQVGQPNRLSNAPAVLVPVTIEIPKGVPPCDYLGVGDRPSGHVLLKTGFSEAPELKMNLSFAVES